MAVLAGYGFMFSYITGKYRQRDLSSRIYGVLNTRPKGTTWVWQGQAVYGKKEKKKERAGDSVQSEDFPLLFLFIYFALHFFVRGGYGSYRWFLSPGKLLTLNFSFT